MSYRFRIRRVDYPAYNEILLDGEPGVDQKTDTLKIGDGKTHWSNLPPYTPRAGDDPELPAALADHIASANPHPVYDDGPSLLLLYQNAKV